MSTKIQKLAAIALIVCMCLPLLAVTAGAVTTNGEQSLNREIIVENYTPEYGTIAVDRKEAKEGEIVTITIEPEKGCWYSSVPFIYCRRSGTPIARERTGLMTWAFVMPDEAVVVTAGLESDVKRQIYVYTTDGNYFEGEGGTLTVSPNDDVMIDEPVSIAAVPDDGYYLLGLYYELDHFSRVDLVTEPTLDSVEYTITESGALSVFVKFAQKKPYTIKLNTYHYGGAAGEATLSVNEAYPGETVTVTLKPGLESHLPENALTAEGNVVLTDNRDGTWSFVMPWHEVELDAVFVKDPACALGGVVTDARELWQALGGRVDEEKGDIHELDEENQIVTLTRDVALADEVVVVGGPITLLMDSKDISGAVNKPAFRVANGEESCLQGKLTIGKEYESGSIYAGQGAEAISVEAGELIVPGNLEIYGAQKAEATVRVEGGNLILNGEADLYGPGGTEKDSSAVICVNGGRLTIGDAEDESAWESVLIEGQNCDDGIRIIDGRVTMYNGRAYGGSYWNYITDASETPELMGDEGTPDLISEDQPGGSAVHVSDSGAFCLIYGELWAGTNGAALLISGGETAGEVASGEIRVENGILRCDLAGNGLVTTVDRVTDLQITGGAIYQTWRNERYPMIYNQRNTVELQSGVLADYVPVDIVIRDVKGNEIAGDKGIYDFTLCFEGGERKVTGPKKEDEDWVVRMECNTQRCVAIAAFYNADGKLLETTSRTVERATTRVPLRNGEPEGTEMVKVFFMDENMEKPLIEPLVYPAPETGEDSA